MELLSLHLASKFTAVTNSSVLPPSLYKTNDRLASVNIKEDDIYLILKTLNPEKGHASDDISIWMIQLCGKVIVEQIVFLSFLEDAVYTDDWK